jgi:hypothetical protein
LIFKVAFGTTFRYPTGNLNREANQEKSIGEYRKQDVYGAIKN